ncbi:hypothetical protein DOY81_000959, partial [Sarcophaga bullata]
TKIYSLFALSNYNLRKNSFQSIDTLNTALPVVVYAIRECQQRKKKQQQLVITKQK